MLTELTIRNFAIIEDLTIRLGSGLTILSGETGAGKSIIINAVNLLLGGRATPTLIRTGADSAELEALFEAPTDSRLAHAMIDAGYNSADGLMIRRIISRNERQRIYVNGRLATMQTLGELTARLAGIAGQHAHQTLLREDHHLAVVDRFGGLDALRQQYAREYDQILHAIHREQELVDQLNRHDEKSALLQFQNREIELAAIAVDEDQTLEKERRRLKNSELLLHTVQNCVNRLYGDSDAVAGQLLELSRELARAADIDERLGSMAAELQSLAYGVEDLSANLHAYVKDIDLDSGQLEAVETRLDLLTKLKRKYGGSLEAVILRGQEIRHQLVQMENIDDLLVQVKKELDTRHESLCRLAAELSEKRQASAAKLAAEVKRQLADLKMAGTHFSVDLHPLEAGKELSVHLKDQTRLLSPTGTDRAVFMISPNVGETAKPLASIASGGELSRVVLAIKAVQADRDALETIVFDEVDAGIGGAVADLVGRKLAHLASFHQILCITHLPQIACYGDQHFRIEKTVHAGRTRTTISALDTPARIMEIARMLGGETITDAALAHAREMVAAKPC